VIPVNPRENEVDGLPCVHRIADLPAGVHGLSIVTPPQVGTALVEDAAAHGIKRVWFQPGAESAEALARAKALGMVAIADGACVMVALARRAGAQ